MLEKILTCKCYHQIIRMEEEGISNLYIDGLMEKISDSFRGTFPIDKIDNEKLCNRRKAFHIKSD